MHTTITEEKYIITPPEFWTEAIDDATLTAKVKDTDFTTELLDKGKEVCYYLDRKNRTTNDCNEEYVLMAYTLTQPGTLDRASIVEEILEEHEVLKIHRIGVFRNGGYIDKTEDLKIKVLDHEDQSDGGVINSSKKVNITIKDLRLYDVVVLEHTKTVQFTDKDIIRKRYYKNVWVTPDVYWHYVSYNFALINERAETIIARKTYFRDANNEVLAPTDIRIAPGERFTVNYEEYNNPVDASRQVYAYVDFATEATWTSIMDFVVPMYEVVAKEDDLRDYAPDLISSLEALPSLDHKIAYAIEYVQNHIKYIYNEEEMHGHKPQAPKITFINKQGDCKAKCMLLKVILDYLNVDNNIVLVNFNTDYYHQFYLPSPLNFNHVIVKIDYQGSEYFIDATARDEYGLLPNRTVLNFKHYLPISSGATLQARPAYQYQLNTLDEVVHFDVKEGVGQIKVITTYRQVRANNMRRTFKNTHERELLDSWYNYLFYALSFSENKNEDEKRSCFKNASLKIVQDNKELNEFVVEFNAELPEPYYINKEGNKFLMYYDNNVVKSGMKDFIHEDFTYWHGLDSERYEIHISSDKPINLEDEYTKREFKVDNPYFKYEMKKKLDKHQVSVFIKYDPVSNTEIPKDAMAQLKSDYKSVGDSNYGVGVGFIEESTNFFTKNKTILYIVLFIVFLMFKILLRN